METFCQKLIASNTISAFLDHLKPKIFFAGQPRWPTYSVPLFRNPGSTPEMYSVTITRAFRLFMIYVTRLTKLPQEITELILILEYIHVTLQIIIHLMNYVQGLHFSIFYFPLILVFKT